MTATTTQEQTALTLPQRASVALGESANIAKLRELAAQSAGILAVTNADGRKEAHRAGMVLRETRTNITSTGKAAREDATAFSKAVIALEKELIAVIEPEEIRVMALRDAFDEQLAAEKAARIAAERARTDAIQADIERLREIPQLLIGKGVPDLQFALKDMHSMSVEESRFEEYLDAATKVVAGVVSAIEVMLAAAIERERIAAEAEAARIAEAARLEAEKAELAAQRAENERIANEQAAERQRLADLAAAQEAAVARLRAQAEANLQAERDAQAELVRQEREKMAEEQAKVAEQVARLAAQQAAADKRDADALAAQQAAEARDRCHGEALEMNAQFDIDAAAAAEAEAERVRLQELADQAIQDVHVPTSDLEALMDSNADGGTRVEGRITDLCLIVRELLDLDYTPDEIRGFVESELDRVPA